MKNSVTFSPAELDRLIEQLETYMVQLKQQSASQREEIQATFPTLSRERVDAMLADAPRTPDALIAQMKGTVQYLIGKKY